jgi:hypothetical protein
VKSKCNSHSTAGDLAIDLAARNTDIRHGAVMRKGIRIALVVERCLELTTVTGGYWQDLAAVWSWQFGRKQISKRRAWFDAIRMRNA